MNEKQVKTLLRSHFYIPDDTQRLANLATFDLLWGPVGLDDEWERENYKGFQLACARISEYVDTLPCELWVDTDCDCVMTSEPQGQEVDGEWLEPYWESIYYIDSRSKLVQLLLNEYLVDYV